MDLLLVFNEMDPEEEGPNSKRFSNSVTRHDKKEGSQGVEKKRDSE